MKETLGRGVRATKTGPAWRVRVRAGAAVLAAMLALLALAGCTPGGQGGSSSSSLQEASSSGQVSSAPGGASGGSSSDVSNSTVQNADTQANLPDELRAMWISYLEWMRHDLSTEEGMRTAAAAMFDECAGMGLNTVIVAVRPFGDALYKSEVYPWSHLLTGTQGQDPGYDPLALLVEEAHARGLRIEAWVNPYRVDLASGGVPKLAEDNPAAQHPEWAKEVSGVWLDPGLPEVQELVVAGIREIVHNYDVDGVHIDDYFYPEFTAEQRTAGDDDAFDEETYLKYGVGKELATWRRDNVSTLVADAYAAVKEEDPTASFGISPQGNNENNYTMQYSDVQQWLANPGYADYIMPQLYWGFGYRTAGGRDDYAFEALCESWAAYPRDGSVRLCAGLGAYRVGAGDGGNNAQDEWESGHNLADMVEKLRSVEGFSGFGLFRYDSLFAANEEIAEFAGQEVEALAGLLSDGQADKGDGGSQIAGDASSGSPGSHSSDGETDGSQPG